MQQVVTSPSKRIWPGKLFLIKFYVGCKQPANDYFCLRDMNQKLRDDKDAIEAAHEAVSLSP